ncbi:MAG: hypothetical protein ACI9FN_002508 [Saprospiraceae bacterium]|jgi:hypothetical protein
MDSISFEKSQIMSCKSAVGLVISHNSKETQSLYQQDETFIVVIIH